MRIPNIYVCFLSKKKKKNKKKNYFRIMSALTSASIWNGTLKFTDGTVNPRYNDSICSQRCCHLNEFAVVQNT